MGCFYTERDARNQRRANVWLFAAAFAYAGATFALRWRESLPGGLPAALTGLTVLLVFQAIRSYRAFLRDADELLRRIQTEALAFGFGVGAGFALLYPLLEQLGAPRIDKSVTGLVLMLAWGAGSWLAARRYSGRSG